MRIVTAGQDVVLTVDLIVAAGTDVTTGSVTCYLRCTAGANAGKWWNAATASWSATLASAGSAAHVRGAQWELTVAAAAWTSGSSYSLSADHSGAGDIGVSYDLYCGPSLLEAADGGDTVIPVSSLRTWCKRSEDDDANLLIALAAAEDFAGKMIGQTIDADYLADHKAVRVAILAIAAAWIETPEAAVMGSVVEVPNQAMAILTQARGFEP